MCKPELIAQDCVSTVVLGRLAATCAEVLEADVVILQLLDARGVLHNAAHAGDLASTGDCLPEQVSILGLMGGTLGVLQVFRTRTLSAAEERITQAFAEIASAQIVEHRHAQLSDEQVGQLTVALDSRIVIEQAKGILSERASLDMDEAYQAMRLFSRHNNHRLQDVADRVVKGELNLNLHAKRAQP